MIAKIKTSAVDPQHCDGSSAADPGKVTQGTPEVCYLGINAKFANARDFQPAGLGPGDGSENAPTGPSPVQTGDRSKITVKSSGGLLRVKYAPSGVDPEKLTGTDLQVFKRALRWQRLRGVQYLLSMGRVTKDDKERVTRCYRVRFKPDVEVWRSEAWKRAHYKNLIVCASVWACPVCSAKITERRKIELQTAPRLNDFSKFMVTYTFQHKRSDNLKALYDDLSEGLRDMKNSRGYKNLLADLQIVGSVTGSEVTVSDLNGWHPHKHALMFSELLQDEISADEIQGELAKLFITALQQRGRYAHIKIGVNVQTEHVIAAYVAKMGEGEKWTLAAEIAKSAVKTGKSKDHFHPFELIDMYLSRNQYAGKLFLEYVYTMKGKKQLFYSPGLRELLGLGDDISDQEIAERVDDDAALFAQINADQWQVILKHEKRGQLLEVASTGNYSAFVAYMRALGCMEK
jgi:hypothetical protein